MEAGRASPPMEAHPVKGVGKLSQRPAQKPNRNSLRGKAR